MKRKSAAAVKAFMRDPFRDDSPPPPAGRRNTGAPSRILNAIQGGPPEPSASSLFLAASPVMS